MRVCAGGPADLVILREMCDRSYKAPSIHKIMPIVFHVVNQSLKGRCRRKEKEKIK